VVRIVEWVLIRAWRDTIRILIAFLVEHPLSKIYLWGFRWICVKGVCG
jgi:hypothetical protein